MSGRGVRESWRRRELLGWVWKGSSYAQEGPFSGREIEARHLTWWKGMDFAARRLRFQTPSFPISCAVTLKEALNLSHHLENGLQS